MKLIYALLWKMYIQHANHGKLIYECTYSCTNLYFHVLESALHSVIATDNDKIIDLNEIMNIGCKIEIFIYFFSVCERSIFNLNMI